MSRFDSQRKARIVDKDINIAQMGRQPIECVDYSTPVAHVEYQRKHLVRKFFCQCSKGFRTPSTGNDLMLPYSKVPYQRFPETGTGSCNKDCHYCFSLFIPLTECCLLIQGVSRFSKQH